MSVPLSFCYHAAKGAIAQAVIYIGGTHYPSIFLVSAFVDLIYSNVVSFVRPRFNAFVLHSLPTLVDGADGRAIFPILAGMAK